MPTVGSQAPSPRLREAQAFPTAKGKATVMATMTTTIGLRRLPPISPREIQLNNLARHPLFFRLSQWDLSGARMNLVGVIAKQGSLTRAKRKTGGVNVPGERECPSPFIVHLTYLSPVSGRKSTGRTQITRKRNLKPKITSSIRMAGDTSGNTVTAGRSPNSQNRITSTTGANRKSLTNKVPGD